jgi:hypothetical protein
VERDDLVAGNEMMGPVQSEGAALVPEKRRVDSEPQKLVGDAEEQQAVAKEGLGGIGQDVGREEGFDSDTLAVRQGAGCID